MALQGNQVTRVEIVIEELGGVEEIGKMMMKVSKCGTDKLNMFLCIQ